MKKLLKRCAALFTIVCMLCALNVGVVNAALEESTVNITSFDSAATWHITDNTTGLIQGSDVTGTKTAVITNYGNNMVLKSNSSTGQNPLAGSLKFVMPDGLEDKLITSVTLTGAYKLTTAVSRTVYLSVYEFPSDWGGKTTDDADAILATYPTMPEDGTGALSHKKVSDGGAAMSAYEGFSAELDVDYINRLIANDAPSIDLGLRLTSPNGYPSGAGGTQQITVKLKDSGSNPVEVAPDLNITYIDKPLISIAANNDAPYQGDEVLLTVNTADGFDGDVEIYEGETLLTTLTSETGYTYTVEAIESGAHTYTAKTTVEGIECTVSTQVTAYSSTETIKVYPTKNMNFKRKATSGTDAAYLDFNSGDQTNSAATYSLKSNLGSAGQRTHSFMYFNFSNTDLEGKAVVDANVVVAMDNRWTSNATSNPTTEGTLVASSWNNDWALADDVTTLTNVVYDDYAQVKGTSQAIPLPDVDGTAIKIPVKDYINEKLSSGAATVVVEYSRATGSSGNEILNYYTSYADSNLRPYLELTVANAPEFSNVNIYDGDTISKHDATITGDVSVEGGEIVDVKMYINDVESDISVSYQNGSFEADLSSLEKGEYSIYFEATDDNGASATTNEVTFNLTDNDYSIRNLRFENANGDVIKEVGNNISVTAKCNVANASDSAKNVRLVIALYGSDNSMKLVSVCDDPILVSSGNDDDFEATLTFTSVSTGDYVKAFLWNDFNDIYPYANAIKIVK